MGVERLHTKLTSTGEVEKLYFDLDPVDLTSGVGAVGPVSTCEVHICEGNVPWALDLE